MGGDLARGHWEKFHEFPLPSICHTSLVVAAINWAGTVGDFQQVLPLLNISSFHPLENISDPSKADVIWKQILLPVLALRAKGNRDCQSYDQVAGENPRSVGIVHGAANGEKKSTVHLPGEKPQQPLKRLKSDLHSVVIVFGKVLSSLPSLVTEQPLKSSPTTPEASLPHKRLTVYSFPATNHCRGKKGKNSCL